MNFHKALGLVIALFVVANSLLGIANYNKHVRTYLLSSQREDYIKEVLESEGVTVEAALPQHYFPTGSIWVVPYEVTSSMRDQLVAKVLGTKEQPTITRQASTNPYEKAGRIYTQGTIQLGFFDNYISYKDQSVIMGTQPTPKKQALEVAKRFMSGFQIENKFKNVKIHYRSESHGAIVTYYEVYKGLPIFDSSVSIRISNDAVYEAVFHGVELVEERSAKKEIYPVDIVLFGIRDVLDKITDAVITEVSLGYGMQGSEGIHVVREEAVPMYKIVISGLKHPVFVNAYTNTIEKNMALEFEK